MATASKTKLEKLHEYLADTMLHEMKRQRGSEEGVQASLLSAVSKFLKDNHIESGVGEGNDEVLEAHLKRMAGLPYDGEVPDEYKQ